MVLAYKEVLSDLLKEDYNENHPHGSLGGKSPRKYLKTELKERSKYQLGKMSKFTVSSNGQGYKSLISADKNILFL